MRTRIIAQRTRTGAARAARLVGDDAKAAKHERDADAHDAVGDTAFA